MKIDYKNYEQEREEAELNGDKLLGNLIKEKIRLNMRIAREIIEYQQFKLTNYDTKV